ncbi:MAG TPA: TMEM165/GDT1 family protein [Clostridiales bacterium]|nr:TMEM165/GDT1 family protein [Clostridiales bacterium]
MLLKVLLSTFLLVFIAELGDKTQLATMMMASRSGSIWYVFIGSAAALVCSSFLGVIAGSVLTKYVPASYLQTGSAIAFIIIGVLLLFNKI